MFFEVQDWRLWGLKWVWGLGSYTDRELSLSKLVMASPTVSKEDFTEEEVSPSDLSNASVRAVPALEVTSYLG